MRDFRVVQAKSLLKVASVAPVRNFSPPAIVILGERLNTADEITYNGLGVSEFIITSPTRIIARIPDSQVGQALRDLRVLAPVSVSKLDAMISLGINRPVRTVEGIDRLVQEWLLIFLTNPGSDIFNQTAGGGARSVIGQPASSSESNAVSELSLAVEKTKQQLLRQQAKNSNIPPAERLLSASLSDVTFDQQTTSLTAVVDLKNVLGGSASVTVG
jgi:hypothetical protein